eukprot:scaffold146687_cov32-Prasinocladus_malaysianus.AAC.1
MNVFVSVADLLQLGAAEAVSSTGGPFYTIKMGRIDSDTKDTYVRFVEEDDCVYGLIDKFADMGMDMRDFVALSGAHTIGHMAADTPNTFDNKHFQKIRDPGNVTIELPSDSVMMEHWEAAAYVNLFADNEEEFFLAFAEAMIK